ncbi:MAG TPA: TetR/AcrR family transcriptional regulator [Candidatus Limnocylindrales bacterium]|jgi:AcrR family transcriptional regulator|nr:TetR/AcrR family transcriptional regulator [Candidatus Limnocylindrales bacterium]
MIETGARRREMDEVASELFHANGYAATSVRDIAKALDIQAASMYAHVASKEDLLWAIVDRAASAFEAAAERAIDETADGDAVERLAALVEAHVEVVTADPERSSVFVTEWRHLSGGRRAQIAGRRDAYEARFRATIADGVAIGAFGATDPAIAATFILTALNGIATWYRPDGRLSADRIADHYVELALRSLSEDHP